jgi:hypothetical protein
MDVVYEPYVKLIKLPHIVEGKPEGSTPVIPKLATSSNCRLHSLGGTFDSIKTGEERKALDAVSPRLAVLFNDRR